VPARSCAIPVAAVGTKAVATIEGLAASPVGRRLQQLWAEEQVPQCGYCQSGRLMAAAALLRRNSRPADAQIDAEMTNICRCGTYPRIRTAIRRAVAYRLSLLAGKPRMQHVLRVAAERARWGSRLAEGQGRGVAFFDYDGTYVAHVVDLTIRQGTQLRIDKVTCVFDCGQMVNPDTVRAQVEGSIAWGLSAALNREITVERGRTVQSNFHDYPVLQLKDMPLVDIHLVENSEAPTGAGERAVPGIAPAVTNAMFSATGRRVRTLPVESALRKRS
jgi:hypothetical protein